VPERQIHAEEFGFAKRGPEASKQPLDLPEPADAHYPPSSKLPGVLFALAFAVFAFAGGVLVGQSRNSGGGTATTTAPAIDTSPAAVAAGKAVFVKTGCGACHVLASAGATGKVGPSLDSAKPDAQVVIDTVTHGKGAMPAYGRQLTPAQIEHLAAFVSTTAGS
jgi:mono/diheme cytochrome c family protein